MYLRFSKVIVSTKKTGSESKVLSVKISMHLPGTEDKSSSMAGNTVAAEEPDFSEFMWMAEEDLECFDNEVLQEVQQRVQRQLMRDPSQPCGEEEMFLQQMLDEEEARDTVYFPQFGGHHRNLAAMQTQFHRLQLAQQQQRQLQNGAQYSTPVSATSQQNTLMPLSHQPATNQFKLNPDAAVFVPRVDGGTDGRGERQGAAVGVDDSGTSEGSDATNNSTSSNGV